MKFVSENELKGKVALRHLLAKWFSAMLRMLALQFYSWEPVITRSACRNNIETSVTEEGRRTTKCVSDVRGTSPALRTVTGSVIAATNAIIAQLAANLTQSVHTGYLGKIPDTATNCTAICIGKYSVRNSACSNVLGQCEKTEGNCCLCAVYQETVL